MGIKEPLFIHDLKYVDPNPNGKIRSGGKVMTLNTQ